MLNLSQDCIDFISHCLQFSYKERASAAELKRHPFITKQNSELAANQQEQAEQYRYNGLKYF
jgi:serine/threonine protein kinase